MWLIKGIASGLLMFAVFFVVYFVKHIAGGLRPNLVTGVSAITRSTVYRPLIWLAFVLTLTPCVYARLIQR